MSSNLLLSYQWEGQHSSFFVDSPLTLATKKVKFQNGEALYLQVKNSRGLIISFLISIPPTSSENGLIEMSLSLSSEDSKKSTTISSPTENTNPFPTKS